MQKELGLGDEEDSLAVMIKVRARTHTHTRTRTHAHTRPREQKMYQHLFCLTFTAKKAVQRTELQQLPVGPGSQILHKRRQISERKEVKAISLYL